VASVRLARASNRNGGQGRLAPETRDHITLQIRSVDRIFLHAYVPALQGMY